MLECKFIFDSACLTANLGYEGLYSSANILQIADVVVELSSCCLCRVFNQKFAYSFVLKRVKSSAILYHYQNN